MAANSGVCACSDWGWGDVGAYGANGPFALSGTNTRTPTLDALAANGTLFTDFHVGQAYCAPSRKPYFRSRDITLIAAAHEQVLLL